MSNSKQKKRNDRYKEREAKRKALRKEEIARREAMESRDIEAMAKAFGIPLK